MKKRESILGLGAFNLSESKLRRLGSTKIRITAHMDSYKLTPAVIRRPAEERHKFLEQRSRRSIQALEKKWPSGSFKPENQTITSRIDSTISAKDVFLVAAFPEIDRVNILGIRGYRRNSSKSSKAEYYCVRAKVAVQIESQRRGLQTWEDRFILVQASGFDDAIARLEEEWKGYANPYLNSDGYMVRWKLDEIVDVYATGETTIDPSGTEVYSSLQERRMKKENEWRT